MTDDALAALAAARPPPLPPISEALDRELAKLDPVASRNPMRQLLAVLAISLAYGAALLAVRNTRRDLAELPMFWLMSVGLIWFAGFALTCALSLVPARRSMLPRTRATTGAMIATITLFPIVGLVLHPSGASSLDYGWTHIARGHGCLWWGLVVASVPIIVGAWCLRGAWPVRSRWTCAALGAAGGCLGGLLLHLHCPIADAAHVGLVHGAVVGVAALLAAALGPRLVR